MSGDQKKTIYDMGTKLRSGVDVEQLTRQFGSVPNLDDMSVIADIIRDAMGVTGIGDNATLEISVDPGVHDETVVTVAVQGSPGAAGAASNIDADVDDADLDDAGMDAAIAEFVEKHEQSRLRHEALWDQARAKKLGDPSDVMAPSAAASDIRQPFLAAQLPPNLTGKIIGLRVRTAGETSDGKDLVEVEITLHPDHVNVLSIGDIMFSVNIGHPRDPRHMSAGRVWVSTATDYEAEIAKVEALVEDHIREYENDGILERLRKAYALVDEIGQHAKTVVVSVSGVDDPMRINPNATYPNQNRTTSPISGKFLQEFLQAYDRLAKVLNPVMMPVPKPKPRKP